MPATKDLWSKIELWNPTTMHKFLPKKKNDALDDKSSGDEESSMSVVPVKVKSAG